MSQTFVENLPEHYRASLECTSLQGALQAVADELRADVEDLIRQLFVDTATWGLRLWEEAYGIPTNVSLSYEVRREIVKAAIRGAGTCTVQLIKDTAISYTNAEIELTEDSANYRFVIKFVGKKGIPPNMEAFCRTIDSIKPAHLAYSIEYTYSTWADVRKKTWADLRKMTWGKVRLV